MGPIVATILVSCGFHAPTLEGSMVSVEEMLEREEVLTGDVLKQVFGRLILRTHEEFKAYLLFAMILDALRIILEFLAGERSELKKVSKASNPVIGNW